MTKSKKFLLTTVCALMLTLCTALGGISLTARATNVPFKNDGTWFAAPDLGGEIPSVWTFNEDGTLTSTNTAFTGNMLMTTNADLVGDYAIEAIFQGSNNTEVRNEINMGFTPWYLDANNYVIVYMKWQPDKGFNLINIQTAYKQNGGDLSWGDCWLDFAYKDTLFTLKPTDSIKMRVEKRLNATNGTDEYFVTVSSGDISETPSNRGIAMSVPYCAKPAYVGLYTNNDTVKISNFKTESVTDSGVYKTVAEGTVAKSSVKDGWTANEGNFTVKAAGADSALNQAIKNNEIANQNYAIAYTANCGANGNQLSILPLYRDENNFVRFVIDKTATGANVSVDGKAAGVAFSETGAAFNEEIDWANVNISASRVGSEFGLRINGKAAMSYANSAFIVGANVGFGAGGDNVTFVDVKITSLEYNAYDWFAIGEWWASAQTKDSVAIVKDAESGKTNLTLAAISDKTKVTGAYIDSGKYDQITLTAEFGGEVGVGYGFYTDYVDNNNYNIVWIAEGKVTINSMKEGAQTTVSEANLPAEFDGTKKNVVSVSVEVGEVKVVLNEKEIITAKTEALAGNNTVKVGVVACGGTVTAENFVVDGFWPYKTRTIGAWNLNGARINSWQAENNRIIADGSFGTGFKASMATSATEYTPANGYYFGAKVTVTNLYASEWKTGIMPYYKDGGNHVFVWLSQWAGNVTTITMTAQLGGKAVGNEWRETQIAYTMEGAVNYIEVYVKGDAVYVYLNKSFAPTVTTSFEGLGAQPAAQIGLNNFNTSAVFEEVTVSENRIFTEKGKPQIEKIGSVPTTAKKGEAVKLPVFSATGVGGTIANVTVVVKDENGKEYAIEKNMFTPDNSGKYFVTVTATDAWGNTETQNYEIQVEKTGGCGSAIGSVYGMVLVAAAVAIGLLLFVKKKENN